MLVQKRQVNKMQEINANLDVVRFLIEARNRGFEDWQLREVLLKNKWPSEEIEKAFAYIKAQEEASLKKKQNQDGKIVYKYKNSITIHLDEDVLKVIEKRAKKNMLTSTEQIEDIIRRSCVSTKKSSGEPEDKVDDLFLKLFSRKRCGRQRKM